MTGRRLRVGVLVAVVALLGLAGCAQDNTPDAYDTLTQQNFLELCTNTYWTLKGDIAPSEGSTSTTSSITVDPKVLDQTNSTIKADVTAPTTSQCVCQYNVFVNQVSYNKSNLVNNYNGPYFVDLNASLKTDPEKAWNTVPEGVRNALQACVTGASTSTTSTTVASTSTTAASN